MADHRRWRSNESIERYHGCRRSDQIVHGIINRLDNFMASVYNTGFRDNRN